MNPNNDIFIRRIQVSDAKTLLLWENNPQIWSVSDRNEPLDFDDLWAFIQEQQDASEFDLDQIRYMIIEQRSEALLGTLDLYEIDWEENTAFVGILIAQERHRGKGFAAAALKEMYDISMNTLELDRLFARIQPENVASISLFEKNGFQKKTENPERILKDGSYIEFFTFEKWLRK